MTTTSSSDTVNVGQAVHGAAASATAVSEAASASASTRTIGRSSADWYGASALQYLRSRRCGHADASERNVHGREMLAMALVDGAVAAFLVAESLQRAGAHGDADV